MGENFEASRSHKKRLDPAGVLFDLAEYAKLQEQNRHLNQRNELSHSAHDRSTCQKKPDDKPKPTDSRGNTAKDSPEELKEAGKELGNASFTTREKAEKLLRAAGTKALPYLQESLHNGTPESNRRAWSIIESRYTPYSTDQPFDTAVAHWLHYGRYGLKEYTQVARLANVGEEVVAARLNEIACLRSIMADPNQHMLRDESKTERVLNLDRHMSDYKALKERKNAIAKLGGPRATFEDTNEILKETLGAHPNITSLDIGFSSINDEGIREISKLKRLESLQLNSSRLTDIGLESLKDMNGLRTLFLDSTHITDAGIASIGSFANLEQLGLSGVKISDNAIASFKNMNKLSFLDLSDTKITDLGVVSLKHLSQMADLRLSRTKVTDSSLKTIATFTKLKALDLSHTLVTDQAISQLKVLAALEELDVANTAITDSFVKNLGQLKSLKDLDLGSTEISDGCVQDLAKLSNLRHLRLTGTRLSDKSIEQLKKVLPKCEVSILKFER